MKNNPQKSILRILGRKKAVSKEELKNEAGGGKYSAARSIKNMVDAGLAEVVDSGQAEYLRLTQFGRQKLHSLELSESTSPIPRAWDGLWRIVMIDIPEERKPEREALRYLLKKAGFAPVKNSVWVSPYPFEHLFINIKKDLGLSTELMIVVSGNLDPLTQETFLKLFKK